MSIRDGRTATETVRRTEETAEGEHRVISEEFAVLDRAGRLQLPRAHVDALSLKDRVRLRLEDDHVGSAARDEATEESVMYAATGARGGSR